MKIPFNLDYRKEIESGQFRVVTDDGNCPVNILKWDLRGTNYPIIASIEWTNGYGDKLDGVECFDIHGKTEKNLTLAVIVPDFESTPFERELIDAGIDVSMMTPNEFSEVAKVWARKLADKLIQMAKEETVWIYKPNEKLLETIIPTPKVEEKINKEEDVNESNTITFDPKDLIDDVL